MNSPSPANVQEQEVDRLVTEHAFLAEAYARKTCHSMNRPYHTVLSGAMQGLWQACRDHDPSKGELLPRIASLMRNRSTDALRSEGYLTRSDRVNSRPVMLSASRPLPTANLGNGYVDLDNVGFDTDKEDFRFEGALPDDIKEMLQMMYHGFSREDIARRLKKPRTTINARIQKYIKHFKKIGREYTLELIQ